MDRIDTITTPESVTATARGSVEDTYFATPTKFGYDIRMMNVTGTEDNVVVSSRGSWHFSPQGYDAASASSISDHSGSYMNLIQALKELTSDNTPSMVAA